MRKLFVLALALAAVATLPALADAPASQPDTEALAGDLQLDLLLDAPQPVNDCRAQGGGPCICPQYYAPVCGCDGRDYPNPDCASCKVTSWTTGTCDGGGILLSMPAEPAG